MRIGITGVTGLLGRSLASYAGSRGHELVGYSRRSPGDPPPGIAEWRTTVTGPGAHLDPLPETSLDALVHLAGESLFGLWTSAKMERMRASRIGLTTALVQRLHSWQPEHRPKVLLCASGIGAYGSRGDDVLTEGSAPGAGFLADLCRDWEAAASAATALGIRVVHLRSGMILSRDGGAYPLLRRIFKAGLGGRLGSGAQWQSWIHIDDTVRLILWALENATVAGPLNACAPEPVTNTEFTRTLAAALRRPAFFNAPTFALRLLARGMADEMLLCSQRAAPAAALDGGFTFTQPRLQAALADLESGPARPQ